MEYSELSRIIAEATTEALKPLTEKIQSLKSYENSVKTTTPKTEQPQADETDWAMWDRVAKANNYIN